MGDASEVKTRLRETARSARRGLDDDERRRASEAATNRLLSLPELRRAATVLLYAPLSEEIDPTPAVTRLLDRRSRVLLPRVRGDDLELVEVTEMSSLAIGYQGIREPVGPAVDPELVEVAVLPGVAFDPIGGRLGQGGGHYDRLLPLLDLDGLRVGLCFSCQVVPRVPTDPHDEPVDIVVTERATYRTDARLPLAEA